MKIVFTQNKTRNKNHFLNLVTGPSVNGDNDEYVYLQIRYNTYDDVSGYWQNGAVSFNLDSIDFTNKKGIIVKMNSDTNGEIEVTVNFNQNTERTSIDYTRANTREVMIK